MKFIETGLKDAYIVEQEAFGDERGYFARAYCRKEFSEIGAEYEMVQANMSGNAKKGTLRGMHYQIETAPEAKLVRCVSGSVYDVIVDMRPESPTYLKWFGLELTAENRRALLVPPVFAHGYLTLSDGAELFYQTSHLYTASAERGVRYDDPAVGIEWPAPILCVSEKDQNWPKIVK